MLFDLKFAFRQLVKSPGFTLIAILTLALGIGANTAIFSFFNAFFLKNFTVLQPQELVSVYTTDERNPGLLPVSQLNYTDYREKNQVFADMACYAFALANLSLNGEPSQIFGEIISGIFSDLLGVRRTIRPQCEDDNLRTKGQLMSYDHIWPGFMKTMGIPLVAGRDFTASDNERHPLVVMINEHLAKLAWPNRNPVDQTIKVFGSETPVEIIGVVKDVVFDNIGEDPKPYFFSRSPRKPTAAALGPCKSAPRSMPRP